MTKLKNDDRPGALSVNTILGEMDAKRQCPQFEGEVEYYRWGLVFGHYDSRGGAALLFDANVLRGIRRYNESCRWDADDNVGFQDLIEGSAGHIEVVVCGDKLPVDEDGCGVELLFGYTDPTDPGYACYRVESRYKFAKTGDWTEWHPISAMVLLKLTDEQAEKANGDDSDPDDIIPEFAPAAVPDSVGHINTEYRLVQWDVGEDAQGLVLVRE